MIDSPGATRSTSGEKLAKLEIHSFRGWPPEEDTVTAVETQPGKLTPSELLPLPEATTVAMPCARSASMASLTGLTSQARRQRAPARPGVAAATWGGLPSARTRLRPRTMSEPKASGQGSGE